MAIGKRMTPAAIVKELSEETGLSKQQIQGVFGALTTMIKRELSRRGPEEFVLPDLVKLRVKRREAQKNAVVPVPGGGTMVKDIEASKKLTATPLKKLKDMVLD